MPLSTGMPWNSFRQSNQELPADGFQILRLHRAIRIADAPELFCIAKILCGANVEALGFDDGVDEEWSEHLRPDNKPAAQVRNRLTARQIECVDADAKVAAVGRKRAGDRRADVDQSLQRIAHGICSIPSPPSAPDGLLVARFSFC